MSDDDTFSALDPAAVEDAIAEALTRMASQGSVPAANTALKLVDQRRQADAAAQHAAKLAELADNEQALARYFGTLGLSKAHLSEYLDAPCSSASEDALRTGARARHMEIRAIELARVRSGGKIETWMTR